MFSFPFRAIARNPPPRLRLREQSPRDFVGISGETKPSKIGRGLGAPRKCKKNAPELKPEAKLPLGEKAKMKGFSAWSSLR